MSIWNCTEVKYNETKTNNHIQNQEAELKMRPSNDLAIRNEEDCGIIQNAYALYLFLLYLLIWS